MQSTYNNFVGRYTDVFPQGFCNHLIQEFDILKNDGVGSNRQNGEGSPRHDKDDYHMFIGHGANAFHMRMFHERETASDTFFKGLQHCFDEYTTKYSVLQDLNLRTNIIKLQKTNPGQGYHLWHCEQGSMVTGSRVLVFMLYLNTLDDSAAGETEFLYQQVREKPVENTMLIWPAAYTHTHRGNTVFGNKAKYIATGWFSLN